VVPGGGCATTVVGGGGAGAASGGEVGGGGGRGDGGGELFFARIRLAATPVSAWSCARPLGTAWAMHSSISDSCMHRVRRVVDCIVS
jgi:hypothetical protein